MTSGSQEEVRKLIVVGGLGLRRTGEPEFVRELPPRPHPVTPLFILEDFLIVQRGVGAHANLSR